MLTLILAIFCLTTSNLPWFTDLTYQVPMQYHSLQCETLLLSPVTSTAWWCSCFDSIPSFFLELFLHWSPIAHWAPTDLGSSCFSVLSFCLLILFMGFSGQESWVVYKYWILRYCIVISHASKVMLKFSKPGFNSTWTRNFQMFKLDLEKAEEPEIKLSTSFGSLKKQGS